MAYALVANTKAAYTSASSGCTTPSVNTTGASLLVAMVIGAAATPVLSDSNTNSWVGLYLNTDLWTRLFYVENPSVGAGHTFTVTGDNVYASVCVEAFSGALVTSPFDQESFGAVNGTTAQAGSITPTADDELIICGLGFTNGTASIDAGMTITDQNPLVGGANYATALAYKIQTSAAAINPTWTATESSSLRAHIASFKVAEGGAGIVIPVLTRQYRQRWS